MKNFFLRKNKIFISALLAAVIAVSGIVCFHAGAVTAAASDQITVLVNGQVLSSDVPAQIINDRTMLPFRNVGTAMGASVLWDPAARAATLILNGKYVKVTVDDSTMIYGQATQSNGVWNYVTQNSAALDSPPVIVNDSTLVPVRALTESLGATVNWNPDTRTVSIISPPAPVPTPTPTPTPKPVPTPVHSPAPSVAIPDGATMIYNLTDDPNFQSAAVNTKFTWPPQLAIVDAPTVQATASPYGKSLSVSNRANDWFGIDIILNKLTANGSFPDGQYTFFVAGHIDDASTVPSGALMKLCMSEAPWSTLTSQAISSSKRNFTLTYNTALTEDEMQGLGYNIRIQTENAPKLTFVIDTITVFAQTGDLANLPSPWDLTLPSIKDTYANDFLVGNTMNSTQITDAALTQMYDRQYNVVTCDNEMKPASLSSAKDKYNYTAADKVIAWAKANNIAVHAHCLVWQNQSAAWLNTGAAANRAAAKANLESYIANVAGHFAGEVISWDVVNEVFSNGADNFNGSDWKTGLNTDAQWYIAYANGADASKGESGADYIYDAFAAARLADPNAKLYVNDYNEDTPKKAEAIARMVEALNAQWKTDPANTDPGRLLVEGIGMQSHYWGDSFNISAISNAMARFIKTGATISISELDIPMGSYSNPKPGIGNQLTAAQERQQAVDYAELFNLYKQNASHIQRVTFWGKDDAESWRQAGMPLLFDTGFNAKEAFKAVIDPSSYLK